MEEFHKPPDRTAEQMMQLVVRLVSPPLPLQGTRRLRPARAQGPKVRRLAAGGRWTGDRATATPLSFAAEQSLAPRRDGGADRRRADVLVARRRSRGRGSRYAGSAPARYSGGAAADAQAAQEARLCAEIAGHRQAALLRLRIPASATDLPA